jgi:23S rRNA (uracil1939-C5)-methyltransferase
VIDEKPRSLLKVGDHVDVQIESLAYGGEGIAKIDGFVIFVPDAVPGDRMTVTINQCKARFARGTLSTLLQPSPERREPFCIYHAQCGGCSWQYLEPAAQWHAKTHFVASALNHVGKLKDPEIKSIIPSPHEKGYRHKIQIPVQQHDDQLVAGFYAKQSHRVVPIETCPLQPELGNRILKTALALAAKHGLRGWDETTSGIQLKHLIIRLGLEHATALVVVVTSQPPHPALTAWAHELQTMHPEIVGVIQNTNTEKNNVILGKVFTSLSGKNYLHESIRGLSFRISAASFFQVNPFVLPAMMEAILAGAQLTGREKLVDLFCGVGWITLELAKQCQKVVGIESSKDAIADAISNARSNHIGNAEFYALDAGMGLIQLKARGFHPEVLVLDPPRKGCEPHVLRAIRQLAPQRIVYISCNPTTLARDLHYLHSNAYHVHWVQPVDVFPNTYHVESVAVLKRG